MQKIDVDTKMVIDSVIVALNEGDFERCAVILDGEIERRNENKLVDFFLGSLFFWRKRLESVTRMSNYLEKTRYFFAEGEKYRQFCRKYKDILGDLDQYVFVFRKAINNIVLSLLAAALHDPLVDEQQVYLYTARAYKGNGNYEQAIVKYRHAIAGAGQCASAYAELGDCYLLIGNELIGRLFLRESFFINPDEVEFAFLESELVTNIVNKLRDLDTAIKRDYKKWMPVYAVLWDIFTVKRELKTAEYGMLRQKIYALEREYSETKNNDIEPKLLYSYFYLLDSYQKMKNMQMNIDETLLKIKAINPKVYRMYAEKKSA